MPITISCKLCLKDVACKSSGQRTYCDVCRKARRTETHREGNYAFYLRHRKEIMVHTRDASGRFAGSIVQAVQARPPIVAPDAVVNRRAIVKPPQR